MLSDEWPDWLPDDWTMQIRKIDQLKVKCYVDSQGHKCYSKLQVFDYLKKIGRKQANENTDNANGSTLDLSVAPENEVIGSSPGGPPAKLATRSSRKKSLVMQEVEGVSAGDGSPSGSLSSERSHGDSNWLPDGWTVEVKTRKGGNSTGMKYKCYTDPISGQKFFSKPQVLSHLAKTNRSVGGQKELNTEPIIATPISAWRENASTEPDNFHTYEATKDEKNKSEKKTESARLYSDRRVVTRTPAEGLPPGWIKELRLRNDGIKRDPFFVDPLSEYVFFSKKDALRYLEAGDVKSCAMKPMRRDMNADVSLNANLNLSREEMASPLDPCKGTETSEVLTNGFVTELKTEGSGTENPENNSSVVSDSSQNPKRSSNKKENWNFEEVITTTPADGLPPGWIKEIRTKIFATHRRNDSFYTDPVSGYIFRSKLDALRFLETGDVNVCAMRPKMKDKDGKEVYVRTNAVPKPVKTTGEQFVEGGENSVEKQDNDVSSAGNTPARGRVLIRIVNRSNNSPTTLPAQSSKRQKGVNLETGPLGGGLTEDNGAVQEEGRTRSGGSFSNPKEVSDWLPDGWTVEMHYKSSGIKYKIYKESASGKKLYSKPQVLDYLANGSSSNSRKRKETNSSIVSDSSQNPKRSRNKKENSNFEEVITTTPADGLPLGWIKEIRTKIFATHKRNDPFYTDPVSGYIFRSKLDALRFLETGDVNVCVIRPKMKDKDGNEVYVTTNAVPKPVKTTGEQLVEGGENSVEKQDNDVSSAGNTPARGRVLIRIVNRSNNSPTTLPAQSSKRQKGVNLETGPLSGGLTEDNGAVQEEGRTRSGGSFSNPKEVSDWLPDGWSVEVQYKSSGMKYKVIDSRTTLKFHLD